MDKLKRFDDEEFLLHAVLLKVELKASKSDTFGPNSSEFIVEKRVVDTLNSTYQNEVAEEKQFEAKSRPLDPSFEMFLTWINKFVPHFPWLFSQQFPFVIFISRDLATR